MVSEYRTINVAWYSRAIL